jgi:apolipoprotein N-acyltransferase
LAALSGGLQILIFPTPNLYWLCWIAFAPLLLAVLQAERTNVVMPDGLGRESWRPARPLQALLLGWFSGIVWFAGSCYWIFFTMHVYGGLDTPAAFGVLVLFCLWNGLYTALFTWLVALVAHGPGKQGVNSRRALVFVPFLWVGAELVVRTKIISFPWDLLGTAQVDNIPLTRLATVTGVYGLSFEIILVNTVFVAAFLARGRGRQMLMGAAILASVVLQLGVLVGLPPAPAGETARLVQPNLPIDHAWTTEYYRGILQQAQQQSLPPTPPQGAGEPAVDLIAWPESPAPFYSDDPGFRAAVSRIAQTARAYMIIGTVGSNQAPSAKLEPQPLFNSAALIAPDGRWLSRYDKIHLVPFGEYVPFQWLFGFAHQLTREVGNFISGSQRNVFDLGTFKAGTFICYESIFPGEIRQFAANGAQVFVNISNDEWFGHTAAPYQHLNQARMRALENKRWVLRDTNSGITAVIDPYGRVVEQAPRDAATTLLAPFGAVTATTFYTRHGDWFAWLCVIISVGVVGIPLVRKASS